MKRLFLLALLLAALPSFGAAHIVSRSAKFASHPVKKAAKTAEKGASSVLKFIF